MNIMPCQCGGDSHCIGNIDDDHCIGNIDDYDGFLQVICKYCRTAGPQEQDEQSAIAAWNRMSMAVQIAESMAWRDEALDASEWAWNEWSDLAMHKGIEEMVSIIDCAKAEKRRLLDAWEGQG